MSEQRRRYSELLSGEPVADQVRDSECTDDSEHSHGDDGGFERETSNNGMAAFTAETHAYSAFGVAYTANDARRTAPRAVQ